MKLDIDSIMEVMTKEEVKMLMAGAKHSKALVELLQTREDLRERANILAAAVGSFAQTTIEALHDMEPGDPAAKRLTIALLKDIIANMRRELEDTNGNDTESTGSALS